MRRKSAIFLSHGNDYDMKHSATTLLSLLLLLLAGSQAFGAEKKVIDRSAPKVPAWVGGFDEGFLTFYIEAPTLNDAQRLAEQEISSRIISAVARNVSVKTTSSASNIERNGNTETSEEFSYVSAINSANLPYLKGISLAKAADIYWQKVREKSTGREYYEYNVKYPFSKAELAKLVAQFEEYDAARQNELDSLQKKLNTVESADEIKQAVDALEALMTYFFDETRRTETKSLMVSYKALYNTIAMHGEFTEPGKLHVSFTIQGHPFKVYGRPTVKSNCANKLQTKPENGGFTISYSTADCISDEENSISVAIRVGNARLSGDYAIPE